MNLVAFVLLTLAGGCFFTRVMIGPSLADRVVALDGLAVTIAAAVVLTAVRTGITLFYNIAVMVAFVGFVGAVAGARFVERRGG